MPAVPVSAAGEKFSKFDTFSCIFRVKNDKFCVFSLTIDLAFISKKEWRMHENGVCIDAFLCIFKRRWSGGENWVVY